MNPPRSSSGRPIFTAIILASICALSGCLSKPALHKQTFAFIAPEMVTANAATARVLGIKKLEIASPFEGRSLVYRSGDNAYVRDPYAEFLDAPADSLLVTIRERLRDNGSFAGVVEPGSALKPNTFAEISVTRLYGDFRQPHQAAAV